MNGGDDNWQHDVYNAGAMVDAAVHYYRATGKTRLLQVATRLANHMADIMGPPPRKNVVPGHSLGEEALVKLYVLFREKPELTSRMPVPVDEPRYLRLAEFWIENRGNHDGRKSYGSYGQDHEPVLQQQTIEGHAVRATLLCAGLVAAAKVNGRADYLTAAQRLWENMVQRRMYVIGGLGAVAGHEGFGPDYVLPNNGYLETCAAIGAGFFHHNMNLALGDARYADELERVLYNAVLPGVSLRGDTYFYENPLEAGPNRTRWAWHGCPCCPPMFLKIMGALPGYIYAQDADSVYVNLFVGSRANLAVNGTKLALRQITRYPWDGDVKIIVQPERAIEFALNVRLPGWCAEPKLRVNGHSIAPIEKARGYARIQRKWKRGDELELTLPMPVQRLKAHPKVEADLGRVALQRGPLVYCLEATDNYGQVRNLVLPPDALLSARRRADLLGGVTVIQGPALALHRVTWHDKLYVPSTAVPGVTNTQFTAVPYYANANRQPGEMEVWIAESPPYAQPLAPATLASRAKPSASVTFTNPIVARGADPWVIRWRGDYYFCQSRGGRGIRVSKAARLEDIGKGSWARVWSPPPGQLTRTGVLSPRRGSRSPSRCLRGPGMCSGPGIAHSPNRPTSAKTGSSITPRVAPARAGIATCASSPSRGPRTAPHASENQSPPGCHYRCLRARD